MSGIRGFTLIEILLTLTVLSALLLIGIPQFTDFSSDARRAVTRDRMSVIREAIMGDPRLVSGGVYTKPGYIGNCLRAPDTNRLNDLSVDPGSGQCPPGAYDPVTRLGWNGPYLDTSSADWKKDAWGTDFEYTLSTGADTIWGTNDDVRTLTSCGSNAICGDSDDITTIF